MADHDPASILGPTGKIARRLPSYEHRSEQLAMARAVTDAIERPGHLVVEAGTGVGKSFAYLVPSILAAVHQKKKVVISTHTIALQEQLLSKDIPFLQSVMEEEFTAVLVKGRSNYISLRRLDVALQRQDSLFQQVEESDQLSTIRMWSKKTTDGSRADLNFRPFPGVWDAVQSEDGNCLGRKCPRYNDCFFYQARRRAQHANILIVNHALFVTDLALRDQGDFGILPKYDVVILDEAHTFEGVAGQHLGLQISKIGVDLRLARLYNEKNRKGLLSLDKLKAAIPQLHRTRDAADDFFSRIEDWYCRQPSSFNGRVKKPIGIPEILPEELRRLASAIQEGAQKFERPEERIEIDAAELRCRALGKRGLGVASARRDRQRLLGRARAQVTHPHQAGIRAAGCGTEAAQRPV